jgi:hypothetical protein
MQAGNQTTKAGGMMKQRTAKREYFTDENSGMFFALYIPLNPKTNEPWQASREIRTGHDCYLLSDWTTGKTSGVIIGNAPEFLDWVKLGYRQCVTGFSTEHLAIEAIKAEQKKSGK